MANKRSKRGRKGKRSVVVERPVGRGLDAAAYAYARLLMDPCNAGVVQPIYPGSESGFLFRAENFFPVGETAAATGGVFHWTPGYINTSNTECLFMNSVSGSASLALNPVGVAPGKLFLANNARGVRCVAACVRLTFPGAESARAGRVHYGHTSAGILHNGDTVSVDQIAQTLQHYSRTPAETIELVWKPHLADGEFCDPTELPSSAVRDRKSALTVAFTGLPVATGLTFHLTAVYEWTPAPNQGVAHNALGKAVSRNTLDDVLDFIIRSGFKFVRHAGNVLAAEMQGAVPGLVSGMSRTFGLMAAVPVNRNVGRRLMG